MSLEFAGYGITILSKGKKIATGFSAPGPKSSYHEATLNAVNSPEFVEFVNTHDNMGDTLLINVERLIHTSMPR